VGEVFGASASRVGVGPLQLCRLLGWPHPPLSMAFQHSPVSSLKAFAPPHSSSSAPALPCSLMPSLASPLLSVSLPLCVLVPRSRRPLPIVGAYSAGLGLGVRFPLCVQVLPASVSASAFALLLLGVSLSHFPAPWRQLPIVRASASHCSDGHSVLLSATPSAPSPQSGYTGNEVWRGLRARRLSPWTGRTVLDAPATKSFRP
jgi:hypothetical protein